MSSRRVVDLGYKTDPVGRYKSIPGEELWSDSKISSILNMNIKLYPRRPYLHCGCSVGGGLSALRFKAFLSSILFRCWKVIKLKLMREILH